MMWSILAAVLVGTWNGNWFPSGRADHRAHPVVESATIGVAAQMFAAELARMDPDGTNDVILVFNEIRNAEVATNLVAQIGRPNLVVAAVSGYRRRNRLDFQQDVIATTLPVVKGGWAAWPAMGNETPPRGYTQATIVFAPAQTGEVFAVHFKSNYRASNPEEQALNAAKRRHAAEFLWAAAPTGCPVVIAGDLNVDRARKEFANDTTFEVFDAAGFFDVLTLLPPRRRGTYFSKTYGPSSLDHILIRDLIPFDKPRIVPNAYLSDHAAVFVGVRVGRVEFE